MLGRLKSLRSKHAILEARIGYEQSRVSRDMLQLQTLKRLRLRCREEIFRLESMLEREQLSA